MDFCLLFVLLLYSVHIFKMQLLLPTNQGELPEDVKCIVQP